MNTDKLESSILALETYCKKEGYRGYSLYDSHNSAIPFKRFGKRASFYVNQLIKRSPVNFRPLLGIWKGINPKGYGLFLHAYSMLSQLDFFDKAEAEDKAHFFFSWLLNNPSKGYNSEHCWGYNYHWPHRNGPDVPAYTPSVVVTGFVARALLCYYERFHNEEVKNVVKGAASFVLQDTHLYKGKEGYCFSYTPIKKDLTVNANLLAAEVLAYCDYINEERKYEEYISEVIKFTFNTQNIDGSWYYSFDYDTRKPKKQIDFHQGYVLESLLHIFEYTNLDLGSYKDSIQKGLKFYYENQFNKNGWAYWRLPAKWPVDIHNQSQGIITFSKFRDYDELYLPFAEKIADWTIKHMQGKNGNFYYQKWPFLTNKVSYLRWNQAWMLLALAELIDAKG